MDERHLRRAFLKFCSCVQSPVVRRLSGQGRATSTPLQRFGETPKSKVDIRTCCSTIEMAGEEVDGWSSARYLAEKGSLSRTMRRGAISKEGSA